ncbi:MAG: uncharacterized protein A8A55_1169 [Amphiamblys sp. WSBS2006]|nr:MAG: uncharacterized protein A8A55_1169 [Amphiamblys sp. WSBS2006]
MRANRNQENSPDEAADLERFLKKELDEISCGEYALEEGKYHEKEEPGIREGLFGEKEEGQSLDGSCIVDIVRETERERMEKDLARLRHGAGEGKKAALLLLKLQERAGCLVDGSWDTEEGFVEELIRKLDKNEKERLSSSEKEEHFRSRIDVLEGRCHEYSSRLQEAEKEKRDSELTTEAGDLVALQIKELRDTNTRLEEWGRRVFEAQRSGELGFDGQTAIFNTLRTEVETRSRLAKNFSNLIEKLQRRRAEQDEEMRRAWEQTKEFERQIASFEEKKKEAEGELAALRDKEKIKDRALKAQKADIEKLQSEAAVSRSKQAALEKTNEKLEGSVSSAHELLEQTRINTETFETHIKAQDKEIIDLKKKLDEALSAKRKAHEEKIRAEEGYRRVCGELSDLRLEKEEAEKHSNELFEKLSEVEDRSRESEEAIAQMQREVKARRNEKDSVMVAYVKLVKDHERAQRELDGLKEKVSECLRQEKEYASNLEIVRAGEREEQEKLVLLKRELLEREKRTTKLRDAISALKSENVAKHEEGRRLKGKLSDLQERLDVFARERKEDMGQLKSAATEIEGLKRKYTKLQKEKAALDGRAAAGSESRENALMRRIFEMNTEIERLGKRAEKLEHEKNAAEKRFQKEKWQMEKALERIGESSLKGFQGGVSKTPPEDVVSAKDTGESIFGTEKIPVFHSESERDIEDVLRSIKTQSKKVSAVQKEVTTPQRDIRQTDVGDTAYRNIKSEARKIYDLVSTVREGLERARLSSPEESPGED